MMSVLIEALSLWLPKKSPNFIKKFINSKTYIVVVASVVVSEIVVVVSGGGGAVVPSVVGGVEHQMGSWFIEFVHHSILVGSLNRMHDWVM